MSVVLLGGTSLFLQMLTRLPARARRLRRRRRGDARNGHALCGLLGGRGRAARSRRFAAAWPRCPACRPRCSREGCPCERTGAPWSSRARRRPPGRTCRRAGPSAIWAGPGYLRDAAIPILFGRALDERDRPDAPRVAVISETMARQYFGAADAASAVGRRFRLERTRTTSAWIEVVGVARDARTRSHRSRPAGVLPIVRPVGPAADDRAWPAPPSTRRASSAPCSASCAR